jgi:MYXO-CTERM domain-containing protein
MNTVRTTAFALLIAAPTALLAHPDHAPGEPEHWVVAALFAALSLAAVALWQRRRSAEIRRRGPDERR